MTRSSTIKRYASGFSLIEMAVVFFVVALLLGGILAPLATQVEQRQISNTQKTLEEIKEALIGFAIANGRLPCPDKTAGAATGPNDTPNDGVEDYVAADLCTNTLGSVPWVTLGVADRDVWGNRFRYRVAAEFARRPPTYAPFSFTSPSDVRVCAITTCATSLTLANPDGAAAIVLSLGKNGRGAINANTGGTNPAPTSADEVQNTGGAVYVSRVITPAGTPAGEFDDIAIWIPRHVLFNRMVAAGKLP